MFTAAAITRGLCSTSQDLAATSWPLIGVPRVRKTLTARVWTLHTESGFGCHLLGSKIGFHADMSGDMSFGRGWFAVSKWRTSGTPTLYVNGGGATVGDYIVPQSGYYVCSAQLRFDSASGDHIRAIIAINGQRDTHSGYSAISGNRDSTNYRDMTMAGTGRFKKGDTLSVHVYSSSDNSWVVQHESGFGCHQLASYRCTTCPKNSYGKSLDPAH
jgi:hypothetical protein